MSDPSAPGETRPTLLTKGAAVALALLCAAVLAVPLWRLTLRFGNDLTDSHLVYYTATWCDVLFLFGVALVCRGTITPERKWVVVLLSATSVGVVSYWFNWAGKSYDYSCYEHGAMAMAMGANPYLAGFGYPPPLAQVMAALYSIIVYWTHVSPSVGWQVVYVLYQGVQMGVAILVVWMTHWVLLRADILPVPAAIATSVAYLLNSPLRDTVLANQVNLMLLLAMLAFLLWIQSRPGVAGLCLVLASCLKPFLAPLCLVGGRRVLLGVFLTAGLIGASIRWDAHSLVAWQQYFEYMRSYPVERYWVNLSISNEAVMLGSAWHLSNTDAAVMGYLVSGGLATLLLLRLVRRFQTLRAGPAEGVRRLLEVGQVFDLLTLAMLFSPKVWYHHFLLFAPLIAVALATQYTDRPWRCLLAVTLTQGVGNNAPFPFVLHPWIGVAVALSLMPVSATTGVASSEPPPPTT